MCSVAARCCCQAGCTTVCTTRLYDYTYTDDAYGVISVPVGVEPTTITLVGDQYADIMPIYACTDAGFYGSFRVEVVDGSELANSTAVTIATAIDIDDESVLASPYSAPFATLVPGAWTAATVRVVGKARPRDDQTSSNVRWFGYGFHKYSVVVTVDTAALAALDPAPATINLQYKGAFTLATSP